MKFLPLILLLACGHAAPLCVTTCGLQLVSLAPAEDTSRYETGSRGWTCEEFQRVEDASLAAYKKYVTDPRFQNVCAAIKDWPIVVRAEPTWTSEPNHLVAGLTWCTSGFTEIGNVPPMKSSLVHELMHVVQGCEGQVPWDLNDVSHSNWERDGLNAAEKAVNTVGQQEGQCLHDGITCWGGEP